MLKSYKDLAGRIKRQETGRNYLELRWNSVELVGLHPGNQQHETY
jgi:hypothetical protein